MQTDKEARVFVTIHGDVRHAVKALSDGVMLRAILAAAFDAARKQRGSGR